MSELLVHRYAYPGPERIAVDPEAWLDSLPGPIFCERAGVDSSRCRAVVGMLHGNEPSGFRAIHQALRAEQPPRVDTVFFIGAVEAARTEPRYRYRMLPGRLDLNRCFGRGGEEPDHLLAARALELLTTRPLEACVDLHNNSGQNPPYTVALGLSQRHQQLGALFAEIYVHAEWKMGTLMEALGDRCPAVAIECGKAGDPAADEVGWRGLRRFLAADQLWSARSPLLRVLTEPLRITLKRGVRVTFRAVPGASGDSAEFSGAGSGVLMMDPEIERHNFSRLAAGARLGWVRGQRGVPVVALSADGHDVSEELFEERRSELLTRVALTPMMITTVPEIAESDCLFYAVRG